MEARTVSALGVTVAAAWLVVTVWSAAPVAARAPEPAAGAAAARALSDTFAAVAERVKPCVVGVHSEKVMSFRGPGGQMFPFGDDFFHQFFGDQGPVPHSRQFPRERRFRQSGLGSGFILDKEGHILTNYHVVKDVDELKITLADKRELPAEVVGADPQTDLAVIRIKKGQVPKDLVVAELGDSSALRVGDWVLAVGAPFGLEQTVTHGIISAQGRANETYTDFLQTDAPINPGNSGGPLVDLDGKVIGLNTAIATSVGQFAGVGFAIPINTAKSILLTLLKGGKVQRGLLGIVIQPINDDLARQFHLPSNKGALVAQVNRDSAAEKAGIKPGDAIVRYNGRAVEDTNTLRNFVAGTAPGAKVEIVLLRDGKEQTVTAKVGELAAETMAESGGDSRGATDLGLTVETLTPAIAKEHGYEGEKGVLVTNVEDGSPAAVAELQPGDLITEVNRQPVASVDQFQDALAKSVKKDSVLVLLKRKGASQFVIIPTK